MGRFLAAFEGCILLDLSLLLYICMPWIWVSLMVTATDIFCELGMCVCKDANEKCEDSLVDPNVLAAGLGRGSYFAPDLPSTQFFILLLAPPSEPSEGFLFLSTSSSLKLGPLVTTGVWNVNGLGSMFVSRPKPHSG